MLGAGPGGYTAAFRAADLGKNVVLVDRWPSLGGVCLNVGCIPSKALLHAAKVIDEQGAMGAHGISFAEPSIDIEKLRGWKDGVVKRLTGGLAGLAKQRKVTVVPGIGRFVSMNQLEVRSEDGGSKIVSFEQAIIAAGSEPVTLPFIPHDDPRVIDSTGALELDGIPQRLLVIGGGIIGLEMATVYHALGAKVTVVELMDQIIPGADKDIVTPLMKRISKQYEAIHLKAKVTKVEANGQGLTVHFEGGSAPATDTFDRILVAVGRRPNGKLIGAENAGDRGRRARLHPGRSADAHQRSAHLRHRRHRRPADAGPQGGARGQGCGRDGGRQERVLRREGDPVGRLHRSGSRLGRHDRERGQGEGASSTARGCSLGPRAAAPSRSGGTRVSPRFCSTRRRIGSSAAASSGRPRAT